MKMGNIASPWRYDAGAWYAPIAESMRPPAILYCASRAVVFLISRGGWHSGAATTLHLTTQGLDEQ